MAAWVRFSAHELIDETKFTTPSLPTPTLSVYITNNTTPSLLLASSLYTYYNPVVAYNVFLTPIHSFRSQHLYPAAYGTAPCAKHSLYYPHTAGNIILVDDHS